MTGQFRVTVWDPRLIISQIATVIGFFYLSFGLLLLIGSLFTGTDLALSSIFGYQAINFSNRSGVLAAVCYVVNALLGSLALSIIVKRTKLCLDFTATMYLIHLIICWMFSGVFPSTASWWLLTIAAVTVMCVCGEFLCLKNEMQDIPLLGGRVDL